MGSLRRDAEFTSFVETYGGALLRTARLLTGDRWQADDLVQVALTKTYLAWPAARGRVPYAYARRVLVTSHTDLWRRRRWRERSTEPAELPTRAAAPGTDPAEAVAGHDAVVRALAGLTLSERAVLVLRFCEDLSERETARLLQISVGTVKSTSSRALAKLRAGRIDLPGTEEAACVDH
jgi:RNA polymerase sigma-70 factor (sigma-E family)